MVASWSLVRLSETRNTNVPSRSRCAWAWPQPAGLTVTEIPSRVTSCQSSVLTMFS